MIHWRFEDLGAVMPVRSLRAFQSTSRPIPNCSLNFLLEKFRETLAIRDPLLQNPLMHCDWQFGALRIKDYRECPKAFFIIWHASGFPHPRLLSEYQTVTGK